MKETILQNFDKMVIRLVKVSIFLELIYKYLHTLPFMLNCICQYNWKGRKKPMYKIAVVGSDRFKEYTQQIKETQLFPQVQLFYISNNGTSDEMIRAAKHIIRKEKIECLVLGPFDHEIISPHVNILCYAIHPSIRDFLLIHNQIIDYSKTAVVLSRKDAIDFGVLESCLKIKYNTFYYDKIEKVTALIEKLIALGYQEVISNRVVVAQAKQYGIKGYYFYGQKTVEEGIGNAIQLIRNFKREQNHINEITTLLENTLCGVIYTSGSDFLIKYINNTALAFLERKTSELLQQPLKNVFPQKLIQQTIERNTPEVQIQFTLCGVDVIGNIIPLSISNNTPGICLMFEKSSNILEYEAMIQREYKRKKFHTRYSFYDIIGKDTELLKTIDKAKRFAASNSTVLISAETGSGKELFAQSIHNHSSRSQYPFVAINCASIPDTLIESELFGHMPNSFTGASSKGKSGLIERANHGTVFLDDVDALSTNFQSKLLRVMQEHEIIRIGGEAPIPVDVRFIVSTNRNLRKMVEEGTFRNDLYFRVNILNLLIPPLRNRASDIPLLYEYYIKKYSPALFEQISPHFLSAFSPAFAYTYPGNVRELVSIVERFCTLFEPEYAKDENYLRALVCECIGTESLSVSSKEQCSFEISGNYLADVHSAEMRILDYYQKLHSCSVAELARILGVSRATLYNKLSKRSN